MNGQIDLRLDHLVPADDASNYAYAGVWVSDLTLLVEHHARRDDSRSYLAAHDGSVTWGTPSDPQVIAIIIERDHAEGTFTFESTYHASLAFAQNWLIEQGCPPEGAAKVPDDSMKPADDLTVQVELQISTSGSQYDVLGTYTSDYDPCEAWTLTRDSRASDLPVRLFLDEGDFTTNSYTMREGAFADEESARRWLSSRDTPLPQPPEYRGDAVALRTHAALARSVGTTATPQADFFAAPHTPEAGQRQGQGRLL